MNKLLTVLVVALLSIATCSLLLTDATAQTGSAKGGLILVSPAGIPDKVEYKVIGPVQASAQVGYSSPESLYPQLATEARKMGANAVVNVTGGRRVTAFSWGAAHVSGIAVKVEKPERLKGLAGTYH